MKLASLITTFIIAFNSLLNAQVTGYTGDTNPCPERVYQYGLVGVTCGPITWEALGGTIVSAASQTVNVIWNKEFVNNGQWKLRANYTPQGLNGACGASTFMDLPMNVKTVSSFNIGGESAIPCGFRGTKNYTASMRNPSFPADSYKWTTNTGWTTTTTSPTVPLIFDSDNIKWLEVVGYKDECGVFGTPTRLNFTSTYPVTPTVAGPNCFETNGTYTLQNLPANSSIEWLVSGPVAIAGTNSDMSVNITKLSDGVGAVRAKITTPCGIINTAPKQIYLGKPQSVGILQFKNENTNALGYWCSTHFGNIIELEEHDPNLTYEAKLLSYPSMTLVKPVTIVYPNSSEDPFGYLPAGWYILEIRSLNSCGSSDWVGYEVELVDCY